MPNVYEVSLWFLYQLGRVIVAIFQALAMADKKKVDEADDKVI